MMQDNYSYESFSLSFIADLHHIQSCYELELKLAISKLLLCIKFHMLFSDFVRNPGLV